MATAKTKKKVRFPKRELNTWLRSNIEWDHDQWLELLAELNDQGFADWTSTQEGQEEIGLYLEEKRKRA